jgi:hypothetical protein
MSTTALLFSGGLGPRPRFQTADHSAGSVPLQQTASNKGNRRIPGLQPVAQQGTSTLSAASEDDVPWRAMDPASRSHGANR